MKKSLFTLCALVFTFNQFASAAAGEGDVNNVVLDEYRKIQLEYQEAYGKLRRKVGELNTYRGRILSDSKRRAEVETAAADLMRKYSIVITGRYRNETTGAFETGMEISQKDQDNITKLMTKYLGTAPFFGRVSAGEARRQLDWGMRRLGEMAKLHSSPSEENNSELEILAFQVRDSDSRLRRLSDLAKNLGIELTEPASDTAAKPSERGVASQESGN